MDLRSNLINDDDIIEHVEFVQRVAGEVCEPSLAEDVAQEALLRALERRPRREGSLRGWLSTVVANRARELRRMDGRRLARERDSAREEEQPSVADAEVDRERRELVTHAVDRLREPYRSTLILRYREDLAPAEIAARAGVSPATARSRIHRGLEILRADERLVRLEARPDSRRTGGYFFALSNFWRNRLVLGVGGRLVGVGALFGALLLATWWGLSAEPGAAELRSAALRVVVSAAETEPVPSAVRGAALGAIVGGSRRATLDRGVQAVIEPEIRGYCIDEAGLPVADALVTVHLDRPGNEDGWPAPSHAVRTADDGSFTLPAISHAARIWAQRGGDFAVEYLHILHRAVRESAGGHVSLEGVRLVLAPAVERSVNVLDPEGRGVPEARLVLDCGDRRHRRWTALDGVCYADEARWVGVADAEGRWSAALPRGPVEAEVSSTGFLPTELFLSEDGRDELTLDRLQVLRVQVVDPTGEPVARAQVRALDAFLRPAVVTDADGHAWLSDMGAHSRPLIRVEPPEGSGLGAAVLDPWSDVEADVTRVPRLTLPFERSLEGRVVDHDGVPIVGKQIRMSWAVPEGWSARPRDQVSEQGLQSILRLGSQRTDGEGWFRLDGLGPAPVRIYPGETGLPAIGNMLIAKPGGREVTVKLARDGAAPLVGQVLAREGTEFLGGTATFFVGTERSEAALAADGTFSAHLDPKRTVTVRVELPDGADTIVDVPAADPRQDGGARFVEVLMRGERQLDVTVVDSAGRRQPHAMVFPRDRTGAAIFTPQGSCFGDHVLVSEAGEATLEGLPKGAIALWVRHPALRRPERVEVPAGAEAVRVELPLDLPAAERVIEISLEDTEGKPLVLRRPALERTKKGYRFGLRPDTDARLLGRWVEWRGGDWQQWLRLERDVGRLAGGAWRPAKRVLSEPGRVLLRLPEDAVSIRVDVPGYEPMRVELTAGVSMAPGESEVTWVLRADESSKP